MWRRDQIGPAAIAVTLLALAIALALVLVTRSTGGHDPAKTTSGPKPSRHQQHAAGVLSAFVYERGTWYEGGNVKACKPNWRPPANVIAQLNCTSFGQPSIYTRFKTGSQASGYFRQLASQGQPASGDWGVCKRHIPSANWTRTILGSKESGQVAFRQAGRDASVIWIWPNMHTVAQATGTLLQRAAICRAWSFDA